MQDKSNGQQPKQPNGIALDKWIKKAEEEIIEGMKKLQEMEGPLLDYKEVYENLKQQYDLKEAEIELDKRFKDELVRKREGYHPAKHIRQLTVTSATNKPPKKERKHPKAENQIPWKEWLVELFKDVDTFLLPNNIYDVLVDRHKDRFPDKKYISKRKWDFTKIVLPGLDKTSRVEGKFTGKLKRMSKVEGIIVGFDANGTKALKYGLRDWVDENFVPFPKYMKEFMYDDKVSEKLVKIS